ncbi:MAG: hypothetical protein NVS2B12_10650 [Ktedonobacteraceae bacterium]
MLQEQQTLPPGSVIQDRNGERYIIKAIVGQGGFSAVYVVHDKRAKQKLFALKELIHPNSQEQLQLASEAEILRRVSHRSLPRVYQVFENSRLNRIYMLMDYVEGENLETLRREQPEQRFSLALTLTLITPIVEAVIYLHKQETPVIHRDIKPANIIIPRGMGDAVLVDFGLAKEYIQDKTTNVFRYGTPGYAAPEQYGQGTNLRTDIYALGATLYTLLTGLVPVDALTRVMEQDPLPPVNHVNPHIPSHIAQVITRAMSLHSQDRYDSVEVFWQTLSIAIIHAESNPLQHMAAVSAFTSSSLPQLSAHDLNILTATRAQASRARRDLTGRIQHTSRANYASSPMPRRRANGKKIFGILATLILLGLLVDSILVTAFSHKSLPISKGIPVASRQKSSPKAKPTLPLNPYPTLATGYEGSIYDSGIARSNKAQPMYLTNIQQQQDSISGNFHGLGLTLPFVGKVTKDQKIHFTVFITQTKVTLLFDGNIKVGGDMAGGFQSKGPDGQDVQEFGPWNVQQASALSFSSIN